MSNPLFERIERDISADDVVLYMKGSPVFPQCGFSATVVELLGQAAVAFQSYDVLQDAELREGIKAFSEWPTVPQLYVKGEFVGGCDILKEMADSGELATLFQEKGVASAA